MCATGDPRVQRDPSGVTAHHLEHHAPLVRVAGGAQPVDRLGGDLDGGVETEGVVGGVDVVVDGLGYPDDRDAVLEEPLRRRRGALSADRDHAVDTEVLEYLLDVLRAAVGLGVRAESTGAQDGSTLVGQTTDHRAVEIDDVAVDQSVPAVAETDELLAVDRLPLEDRSADHRVQPRAVTPGRQNPESLRHTVERLLPQSKSTITE